MNEYPIPIDPTAAPYVRPHEKRKMRKHPRKGLVFLILMCLGFAAFCFFLPDEMKEKLYGFFAEDTETTSEHTEGTEESTETTSSNGDAPEETTGLYDTRLDIPEGAYPILACDRSVNAMGLFAENDTDAIPEAVMPKFPKKRGEEICVLILNTHSYESYAEEGAYYYRDASFATGNTPEKSVKGVQKALAEALSEHNIPAVSVDCMANSSLGAYRNAEAVLSLALEKYPETVLVIDIHRALLTDGRGALLRPVTEIQGEKTAQIGIVVGADANFTLHAAAARALQETGGLEYMDLFMPMTIKNGRFLQECEIPVLTLEVGSAGNSAEEAIASVRYLSGVIAMLMEE